MFSTPLSYALGSGLAATMPLAAQVSLQRTHSTALSGTVSSLKRGASLNPINVSGTWRAEGTELVVDWAPFASKDFEEKITDIPIATDWTTWTNPIKEAGLVLRVGAMRDSKRITVGYPLRLGYSSFI